MFDFQVFRRAEAKTFPVDRTGIKGRRKERERKRKAKEARKKSEMNPQKKKNNKNKKNLAYAHASSKILYNLQQKLTQNVAKCKV